MKNQIKSMADRIFRAWFDEDEIDIVPLDGGGLYVSACTCVKTYGDGYSEHYDSRYPDESTLRRGEEFAGAVTRAFPDVRRVSVTVHHD